MRGVDRAAELGDRGFGYDPVFIPDDGDGRSFAQMSDDEKNAISHRARALHALLEALRSVICPSTRTEGQFDRA